MIFISNGVPKSATSFSFLLCNEVACTHTPRYPFTYSLPDHLQAMYFDDISSIIDELIERVPREQIYVIKTHTPLNDNIRQHIEKGNALASVTYRDPYDIVTSLLDAGKRERTKGESENKRESFTSIYTVDDALRLIPKALTNGRTWLEQVEALPGLIRTPYETLRKYPHWVVESYAQLLGLRVNTEEIVNKFLNDRENIWEYNKGQSGRGYKEIQINEDHPVKAIMDAFNTDFPQP